MGLPAPVSSSQHEVGDFPHLQEEALGQGLSPKKHLMVKLRQRCWHKVLHFLKCRLCFLNHNLWGFSLCCGKEQGKAIKSL